MIKTDGLITGGSKGSCSGAGPRSSRLCQTASGLSETGPKQYDRRAIPEWKYVRRRKPPKPSVWHLAFCRRWQSHFESEAESSCLHQMVQGERFVIAVGRNSEWNCHKNDVERRDFSTRSFTAKFPPFTSAGLPQLRESLSATTRTINVNTLQ